MGNLLFIPVFCLFILEYESCHLFTVPTLPILSDYSSLVFYHQLGQGPVWSIAVIECTLITVFRFLAALGDGALGFTNHSDRMHRNAQGVLVPLAPKVCEQINGIGLS